MASLALVFILLHPVQDVNIHHVQVFCIYFVHHVQDKENNMSDFNSNKYKQEFAKKTYDRIPLDVPKGQKAIIAQYAKEHGYKSVNNFILQCVQNAMANNVKNISIGDIVQSGDGNSININ